ncbi:peptidase M36 [Chytridium lagenaria]|nr:peptidase M36 [Chytridium lagenaria]
MNMYTCNMAIPSRDTGMDNSVILHEITHGVSNRLTGGASNVWCLSTDQAGGMGEGWSDVVAWWASMRSTDNRNVNKAVGAYSFNLINGIRSYAYSTSLTTNPLYFADIAGRSGQVHFIGTVWSSILYEVYWNMVDLAGFEPDLTLTTSTAGNIRFLLNVLDGMKLQPCNPTLVDARNAILQAESVNNDDRFRCAIWRGFAKRGLGLSKSKASQ